MSLQITDEWGSVRSSPEEAEDSYFVSMTDIMVGLLFIFIIMLMAFGLMLKVAASRTEQTRTDMRDVIQETRDEVVEMQDLDSARAAMLHDLQKRLLDRGVNVIVREENGVLQLPDEILFGKAESVLSPNGLAAIEHLAEALDIVLPCYALSPNASLKPNCPESGSKYLRLEAVFVEGHTDSDGSQDYNWRLSSSRAINTYRALVSQSKTAVHLLNDQNQYLFSVAGYGENRPVDEGDSEASKSHNRRIDLRFVMNVSHTESLERVQKKLEQALDQP